MRNRRPRRDAKMNSTATKQQIHVRKCFQTDYDQHTSKSTHSAYLKSHRRAEILARGRVRLAIVTKKCDDKTDSTATAVE
jgi:hypothetical protein